MDSGNGGGMLTNTTGRELKKAFAESGGNAKYAIVLVSHMSHIPRSDQAKLRTLAAETSKQQLKYLKRAWEEGIEACDRQRCLKTYIRSESIENASLLDIYMRGHAARVQAAEMCLGGIDGGNVGNVDLKQYAHDRGVCYAYQTASCESGPVGNTCRHKHVCLWCGKKHGMRKCFDLVPKELRKQFKPRWNGSNDVDSKRKEKK